MRNHRFYRVLTLVQVLRIKCQQYFKTVKKNLMLQVWKFSYVWWHRIFTNSMSEQGIYGYSYWILPQFIDNIFLFSLILFCFLTKIKAIYSGNVRDIAVFLEADLKILKYVDAKYYWEAGAPSSSCFFFFFFWKFKGITLLLGKKSQIMGIYE